MKKIFKLICLTSIVLLMSTNEKVSKYAIANDMEIKIVVDEVLVLFNDAKPIIVEERTLVPIRSVFETMEFDIVWDNESSTAVLSKAEDVIKIEIGSENIIVNNDEIVTDVLPQIIAGSLYLPLRPITEAISGKLTWLPETNTIVIDVSNEL